MFVFRIEDKKGIGPYHGKAQEKLLKKHECNRKYPGTGYIPGKDPCSGFNSLETYKWWFNGFFSYLHKTNYSLVIYEITEDEILFNDNLQIVFERKNSKQIKKLSIRSRIHRKFIEKCDQYIPLRSNPNTEIYRVLSADFN